MRASDVAVLRSFVESRRRLFVLTGAGVSTASGIPDYRDEAGRWKRKPPVNYRDFTASDAVRRRYWARSLAGWPRFAAAAPNPAHEALAALEAAGRVGLLVTQNVDGLHQRAGSRAVLDLHGRLDLVVCLACRATTRREDLQTALLAANPAFAAATAAPAPDGDADLAGVDYSAFLVPPCAACGGVVKPDVVFFGESVPRDRVEAAYAAVEESDGVLVAGSSLAVWSGYRFVRRAAERGIPVAIVNRGATRADEVAEVVLRASVDEALPAVAASLTASSGGRTVRR